MWVHSAMVCNVAARGQLLEVISLLLLCGSSVGLELRSPGFVASSFSAEPSCKPPLFCFVETDFYKHYRASSGLEPRQRAIGLGTATAVKVPEIKSWISCSFLESYLLD